MVNHNTSGTIIQVDCCLTLHRILTTVVCFLGFYENWSHCFEVRFIKMLYMYSISLSYFWYIIVGASALWDFYSDIFILSLDQNMLSASHDFVTFLNVEDKVDFLKDICIKFTIYLWVSIINYPLKSLETWKRHCSPLRISRKAGISFRGDNNLAESEEIGVQRSKRRRGCPSWWC